MTRQSQKGMTLLEVLLAVTLVSLLSVGLVMAMSMGLDTLKRLNQRVQLNRRTIGTQRVIEQQVAGLIPASADCLGDGSGPPAKILFFQGELQSMRFVSTFSLDEGSRGFPRVLEYQVIRGENGRGVRLVVNEHLYTGGLSTGQFCTGLVPDRALGVAVPRFRPIEVGPGSFVLADKLAYCRFIYREPLQDPPFTRWVPRWILPRWPTAIRIEMAPLEQDPGRVEPMAITLPIAVNKVTPGMYAD